MQSMLSDHTVSITFAPNIMPSFQQKFVIILKKEEEKKKSKEAKQAAKPGLDLAEILNLSDWEFKITMINMLQTPVGKSGQHEITDG